MKKFVTILCIVLATVVISLTVFLSAFPSTQPKYEFNQTTQKFEYGYYENESFVKEGEFETTQAFLNKINFQNKRNKIEIDGTIKEQ